MARMDVSRNGTEVAFRTAFSAEYDLVQVLTGLSSLPDKNCPVDFKLAALQHRGCRDIWHMDQVLAFSTDECSPMVIRGEDIGGNHGHPCALRVAAPGHGRQLADVGTLWRDESGMTFTLLRVESEDSLLLLSENTGPSQTEYAFADHAQGVLICAEKDMSPVSIVPLRQEGGVQLTPAIRHRKRELRCCVKGQWLLLNHAEGCEGAEITEEYEIINPATVARVLRSGRPEGGYTVQPSLAVGEAMFLHRMTYRIEADGTILCSFDHQTLQEVQMSCYLGIMHQLKCDLYGGGIRRYIPKVKPFTAKGRALDFSRPCLTTGETIPNNVPLTPDLWTNPASPPDRQLDFLCRADGTAAVGFACGFLPVEDGRPECRAQSIDEAAVLVSSCKTYPTFAGGMTSGREGRSYPRLKGTAYKKYFLPPAAGHAVYTVPCGEDTYVYMDFFADEPCAASWPVKAGERLVPLETTVSWQAEDGWLTARGASGYACFLLQSCHKKG